MINTVEVCPEIYSKVLSSYLAAHIYNFAYVDRYDGIELNQEYLQKLICDHLNSK